MKKLLCLALALVCAFSIIATASAGTVHGGTFKMRMQPNTSSYVACYLPNGSTVSVYGSANADFYSIGGTGYQHSNLTGWYEWRTGYGMKSFISL